VVTLALRVEFLETGDMKIITASIVIIALVTPKFIDGYKEKKRKRQKLLKLQSFEPTNRKDEQDATFNSD
jgi:putative ABC transport system permease protein